MSSIVTRFCLIATAAVLAACATVDKGAPAAAASAPMTEATRHAAEFHPAQVEVVAAQFGVFGADASGRRMLYETDKFPAIIAAPTMFRAKHACALAHSPQTSPWSPRMKSSITRAHAARCKTCSRAFATVSRSRPPAA